MGGLHAVSLTKRHLSYTGLYSGSRGAVSTGAARAAAPCPDSTGKSLCTSNTMQRETTRQPTAHWVEGGGGLTKPNFEQGRAILGKILTHNSAYV